MNLEKFQHLCARFNAGKAECDILAFLIDNFHGQLNKRPFVLGLSGGIDSAVVAALVTKAKIPLHIMMLPDGFDPQDDSIVNARLMIDFLGIIEENVHLFDIGPLLNLRCAICAQAKPCPDKYCRGNRAARLRMIELYALARKIGGVVCGTENMTEYLFGYFTLHGDAATDIEPIHALLKTHVRTLARHQILPGPIITQTPSARLWPGQTDEGELGFTYDEGDAVIAWLEHVPGFDRADLEIGDETICKVTNQIKNTQFKRNAKPVFDPTAGLHRL